MTWQALSDPLFSGRLCMTLVHSLWQVALVAAVAWGLGWFWQRRSIQRSYALHVAALVAGLAAMPVTYAIVDVTANVPGAALQGGAAPEIALALPPPAAWNPEGSRSLVDRGGPAPQARNSTAGSGAASPALAAPAAKEPSAWWLQAAPWIVAFYMAGASFMLVRLIGGTWRANRLGSKARLIGDGPLVERLRSLARNWSMRIVPALAQAEGIVVPKVVGLARPMILLPVSLISGLSTDELEMILAHELAHVRRYDMWVNLAQRAAEVVLFFNPALWYLSRRISVLREYCCDELTCRAVSGSEGELRTRYASALLRVVELAKPAAAATRDLAVLAASGRSPSEIRRRVARLFGEPVHETLRVSRHGMLTLLALAFALAMAVSVWTSRAQTVAGPTDSETKPASRQEQGPILRGRIIDESGNPLPNVQVVLYGGVATRFRGQETKTTADGEYRFDPLKTGAMKYRDNATSEFYTGVVLEHDEYVPADGTSWRDVQVPMLDRHEHVLDVTVVPGGKVSGIVVDARSGEPVRQLALRIHDGFINGIENAAFSTYATTDGTGRFTSKPVFPGRYVIEINGGAKIGTAVVRARETAQVRLTTRERPDLQDPFRITGTAVGDDGRSMVYGGVGLRIAGSDNRLRASGGGIDGRNVFSVSFGPIKRIEPSEKAPYGVGTYDVELFGWNRRFGYRLVKRTPSEPLRITDDPNQPELKNGIRYIRPNQRLEFQLVFAKDADAPRGKQISGRPGQKADSAAELFAVPNPNTAVNAAETTPAATKGRESLLILNVDRDGNIIVNGRAERPEKVIALEAEAAFLRARLTQPGLQFRQELPTTVEIRADRATPFRALNRVLTDCQYYGFRKFAIKAAGGEKSVTAPPEAGSRVDIAVVVARHVLLLDGEEIITWAELEKKIAALPNPSEAHPHFYITRGAREAGVEKEAEKEISRLHQKFKLKGHSEGSLLPRADFRYDGIKTAKDLVPDQSLRVKGRVVDGQGEPVAGAEVLLVTPVDKSIPYTSYDVAIVEGRIRDPLDEVMTRSDDQGQFSLYPPKGVNYKVVALHPKAGINLARSSQFTTSGEVRLLAWATLVSKFAEEAGKRQEASLRTQVREADGFPEISFNQYWSDLKRELPAGEFRFTHVPPIFATTISRDFRIEQGASFALSGATVSLLPGETRRLDLAPLSEKQREHLEWVRKQFAARDGKPSAGSSSSATPAPNSDDKSALGPGRSGPTERSIAGGLNWLARHQLPDGRWSFHDMPGTCKCGGAGAAHGDVAATALAMLTFLGAGVTQQKAGPYQGRVQKGIDWLLLHQDRASGDLAKGSPQHMFEHGVATLALCEAYGLTKDVKIREPTAQALRFIQAAQNESTGGWGNQSGEAGDTLVTTWQVMALKSGQMAGLAVDPRKLENVRKWLASVASGEHRGLFRSRPGDSGGVTPVTVAAGMLCQQYLGTTPDDPAMRESEQYLMKHPPDAGRERDISYWYFATIAMHHIMGPEWDRWNRAMRRTLISTHAPDKGGCAEGSWDLDSQGGRLMATSLSVLTLEVYYRYLPLYKLDLLPQSPKTSKPGAAEGK